MQLTMATDIASMAAESAGDEPAAAGDGAGDDKPAKPCTKRRKTHMPLEVKEWFCSLARQAQLDQDAVPPLRKKGTPILLRPRAHRHSPAEDSRCRSWAPALPGTRSCPGPGRHRVPRLQQSVLRRRSVGMTGCHLSHRNFGSTFLRIFQDTRILTPQRPPCLYAVFFCKATPLIVLLCFFWSVTARARSFLHASAIPADEHRNLSTHHLCRSTAPAAFKASLAARQAMWDLVQHTSSQPPSAGLCVIPTNKDDTGDGVPTRAGRTTTATVLTTTATATLSLRVCASRPGHYHKTTTAGTFHNVYTVDGIKGDAEREVPEPRGGQALSHLVKTRSGQDTICQDTFHDACFCLTLHHKTSRQPPTRVPSTLSLTQRLLLPLPMQRSLQRSNTWLQHLPLPTYDEPATVIEYVAPAPVVLHAAPAPVIQCSALYKIGQEQKHSCIRKRRKKKDPMSMM